MICFQKQPLLKHRKRGFFDLTDTSNAVTLQRIITHIPDYSTHNPSLPTAVCGKCYTTLGRVCDGSTNQRSTELLQNAFRIISDTISTKNHVFRDHSKCPQNPCLVCCAGNKLQQRNTKKLDESPEAVAMLDEEGKTFAPPGTPKSISTKSKRKLSTSRHYAPVSGSKTDPNWSFDSSKKRSKSNIHMTLPNAPEFEESHQVSVSAMLDLMCERNFSARDMRAIMQCIRRETGDRSFFEPGFEEKTAKVRKVCVVGVDEVCRQCVCEWHPSEFVSQMYNSVFHSKDTSIEKTPSPMPRHHPTTTTHTHLQTPKVTHTFDISRLTVFLGAFSQNTFCRQNKK